MYNRYYINYNDSCNYNISYSPNIAVTTTNNNFYNNLSIDSSNYTQMYKVISNSIDPIYFNFDDFPNTIFGVESYLYCNDTYRFFKYALEDISKEYEEQDFEDKLFLITLDLLCDFIKEEEFTIFDEEIFSFESVNSFINKIINDYKKYINGEIQEDDY